jgi:hypothetical protein
MKQGIIIDVLIKCENYFESISAIESGAIIIGFISNTPDNINDHHELIFLVDCSESMNDNNSIDLARQVLFLFLQNLPIHSQFNIIRFGSTFNLLFDKTITDEYIQK